MKTITISNENGKLSPLTSKIIRGADINREGTVISEEVLISGGDVNLPEGEWTDPFNNRITFLRVPPLSFSGRLESSGEISFINPISYTLNSIVNMINTPDRDPLAMQKMIDIYYDMLFNRIFGQTGLLSTCILGTRAPFSGRLVLSPSIDHSPFVIGIYKEAMEKANIKDGDLLIVFRDPVIWEGSIEILSAKAIEEPVITLHPLVYGQMGADNDGDQIGFIKPDISDPEVAEEIKKNFGKFLRENAKWPRSLCPNGMSEDPDWENIVEDTNKRFVVTGRTYGPRDVTNIKNANVESIEKDIEKEIYDRNKSISEGGNWSIITETNYANLFMKKYLGIVGATSRRLILILGDNPRVGKIVNKLSEIIQQETLDAKHKVGDKNSLPSPIEIREFFERSEEWQGAPNHASRMEFLMRLKLTKEEAFSFLWELDFLYQIKLVFKRNNIDDKVIEKAETYYNGKPLEERQRILNELDFSKVTKVLDVNYHDTYCGLTTLIEVFYPVYLSTTKTGAVFKYPLFNDIFKKGFIDMGSIGTLSLPRI